MYDMNEWNIIKTDRDVYVFKYNLFINEQMTE